MADRRGASLPYRAKVCVVERLWVLLLLLLFYLIITTTILIKIGIITLSSIIVLMLQDPPIPFQHLLTRSVCRHVGMGGFGFSRIK